MALKPNTRLGHYEVLSLIGAGGMGEVYKGRDTRLERPVAIKVLHAHLAAKPELRERFLREAKAIANLQHPHICVLYDVGTEELPEGRVDYLVMEYLPGESLSMRLQMGPLPIAEVLQYGAEISDALDTAHRAGYTHRDIKPGNIMLTPKDGSKLLDFGLAKLRQELAKVEELDSQAPTPPPRGKNLTVAGTILGTLQYMSPEQLDTKKDDVDGRADVFALGTVMYEMVTGRRAFEADSTMKLITAIMRDTPPPMTTLQSFTPPALERVVKKCLQKDRDKRWQTASDLTDELKWIAEGGGAVSAVVTPVAEPVVIEAPAPPPVPAWRRYMPWAAALVFGAAIGIAAWNLKIIPAAEQRPVTRLVMAMEDHVVTGGNGPALALSPNGAWLAYYGSRGGGPVQLFLRRMDSLEARPIIDTEGAYNPIFSPDGEWLAYFAGNKLKKASTSGGAPLTLSDAAGGRGIDWGPDGTIFFTPSISSGISKISAGGGEPQIVTTLDPKKGETSHRWPEVLPNGTAFLFAIQITGSSENSQIVVQSLKTGERRVLIQGGTYPHYSPTGHLLYYRAGTPMAVPFDPNRLEVKGTPAPVLEGIMATAGTTGAAHFAFSKTGSLMYVPGGLQAIEQIGRAHV